MRKIGHLIDGKEVPSAGGRTFPSINPATRETIAQVAFGQEEDVDRAVKSAHRAFSSGKWSKIASAERSRILRKIAEKIEEKVEDLALLDTLDCGKPITDNLSGDVPSGGWLFEYYSGVAQNLRSAVLQGDPSYHQFTRREPFGVVGCIAPWNYPFAQACLKVAPALAAGNTVVLKMAEETPLSTLELGKISLEAGLPEGVLNIVHGDGPTTGHALVTHPLVGKISFTGSTETGKAILRAAAEQVKPVSLELGGKSPNLIFSDADLQQALPAALFSSFLNSGQICTSGSRLLLQEDRADELLDLIVKRARKLRVGNPLLKDTQLGPLVSESQYRRVVNYLELGRREGAQMVCGEEKPILDLTLAEGFFVSPVIFTKVAPLMRIAREEIFGPVLSVLTFQDEEEAVRIANDVSYGLAASIWTQDLSRAFRMADALDAGIIWVNTALYLDQGLPFEGRKQSGFGKACGLEGIHEYSRLKTVYIHHGSEKVQWGE